MRNEITKMENLQYLQNLKVLNLSKNKISKVEGLQFCQRLEKLVLNHQRTKNSLRFDPDSIIGISQTLRFLDVENNRITEIGELSYLPYLDELNLQDNLLKTPFALE
jgi:Leucine-rich repeat (LRR) protein